MPAFQSPGAGTDVSWATPWQNPPQPNSDLVLHGTQYLEGLRQIAPKSDFIDLMGDLNLRLKMCGWIGLNIHRVNQRLQRLLGECQACFFPFEQPPVQVLAAPLAASLCLDGVCNISTQPMALLVDVGRVLPPDWLGTVAHEYAHAIAALPGHGAQFRAALNRLCLGLGLMPPPEQLSEALGSWPPCQANPEPQRFWLGDVALPG